MRIGSPGGLYRVYVSVVIVDESALSSHTLVVPTANPPAADDFTVATIPMHTYRPNKHFHYKLCSPPGDPTGNTRTGRMVPAFLKADNYKAFHTIMEGWDNAMDWPSTISTTGEVITNTLCPDARSDGEGHVYFLNEDEMLLACRAHDQRGCWAAEPTTLSSAPPPARPQAIAVLVPYDWETDIGDCTRITAVLRHEVGHAFGLGMFGDNQHAEIADSIMGIGIGVENTTCSPTQYDVAAMTALYQSR